MALNVSGRKLPVFAIAFVLVVIFLLLVISDRPGKPILDPQKRLILRGRQIFFNETFAGNGRTCGTCHRTENSMTISPQFIATLPDEDALFVAEFNPDLAKNFENPRLMRRFGLILENLDGFDDLANNFVQRGVPHILALRTSVDSNDGPRTGWSGDGSPMDGSLRSFAVGAVIQHFTKTLDRVGGVDFRLPTEAELDALEAFQLAMGRQRDLKLPIALREDKAAEGQDIFRDNTLGKCNICHQNAGANANLGGQDAGNANFNTGVEDLPDQIIDQIGENVPPDDGFGTPGDGTFNTPPLVEAADTGPFFHNNTVLTIEDAVAFYNTDAFNNSPAGQTLAGNDPNGVGIALTAAQVDAVAAFLRTINALENIRASIELIDGVTGRALAVFGSAEEQLRIATHEIEDAITVLDGGDLSATAVSELREALQDVERARRSRFFVQHKAKKARKHLGAARARLTG